MSETLERVVLAVLLAATVPFLTGMVHSAPLEQAQAQASPNGLPMR